LTRDFVQRILLSVNPSKLEGNKLKLRLVRAALAVSMACGVMAAQSQRAANATAYPTGTHLQLVREFYAAEDGLPSNEIRAVAVTRGGTVLAVAGNSVVRTKRGAGLRKEWIADTGPSNVTALLGPPREVEALAGAADGVWILSQDQWRKEEGSPANVIAFATEPSGIVWALAPSGVWRRVQDWQKVHELDEDIVGPRSLLPSGTNDCFVSAESGLFGLMGKRKYWLGLEIRPGGLLSSKVRALARLDADHFLIATDKGFNLSNGTTGWNKFTGAEGLPILDLTTAAVGLNAATNPGEGEGEAAWSTAPVWLGSDQGLVRWEAGRFTYFAGKRWLPDDRVTAIAPASDGSVWVGTPKGLAHIFQRRLSLAEKAGILQQKVEARERRHGFVTEMQLRAPGVLEGALQEISDNDGLWTSLYVASQSFRYAVTKSAEARAQAWRSMQAVLRLESLTGISGFPARAICHVREPQFSSRSIRSHREWHESPGEKDWLWKGDTSSDEIDGHYFGWYVFHELAADEDQQRQVRATCKRVTDHILDHGYYLVDVDKQPTTWGVWAPEKLNDDPKWWHERGLNSLEILSHLKVAMRLVGEPRYEQAYRELIRKHHYALNTVNAKVPGAVSHDNQLLFLAYYPLLQLERDPGLRALYLASLQRAWNSERRTENPLWNFIYGASTGESCDVEAAVQTLREIPLDFIRWKTRNSHRADLKYDPLPEHDGSKRLGKPLPFTERPVRNWDSNPYLVDDGNDLTEADPTVWLLPYWMGRYHRLIQ